MFRRKRRDHEAWQEVEQHLRPYLNRPAPRVDWQEQTMAGLVERIYQRARSGTKVIVDFGDQAGSWDTWWPNRVPLLNRWVLVKGRLWTPPGTHSGEPVIYIVAWLNEWPGDIVRRAQRHERRQAKMKQRDGPQP